MDPATLISESLETIETLKDDLMKAKDELHKAQRLIVELEARLELRKA